MAAALALLVVLVVVVVVGHLDGTMYTQKRRSQTDICFSRKIECKCHK